MKINIVPILFLLLVCSCNSQQEERIENKNTSSSTNGEGIVIESTTYEYPDLELPYNFYLDSITVYDTVSRANYKAYYVQSKLPDKKGLNQASLQFVKDKIMLEQSYVELYDADSSLSILYSYQLRPTEIYTDGQIISVSNIVDTYAEGGNHHNYTRYSFNYNLNTNESIEFNDVFSLENKNDSTEFIRYAEQYTDGCAEWGWPFDYLDFSFNEKGIYINPNLPWSCISTRSLLPLDLENAFVMKKWTISNKK